MPKIGEEVTIDSINIKNFFRLPITTIEENCLLINDGRNSIVKVQERKLIQSWTLTHPNSFTCPVAFCSIEQSVYCIMNSNILLKWSTTDETLKNAAKFKLKKSVFAILSVNNQKPIILFASGKILKAETLSSSIEPFGEHFIKEEENLIWADTTIQESKTNIMCISVSRKDKNYKLHYFTVHENSITDYCTQNLAHESDLLKYWCLNKSASTLYTLWSSGVILNHQQHICEKSVLLALPNIQDFHLLAIESIGSNHVALIKCNPKQKETVLEIWDIKFSALKARKNLKTVFSNSINLLAVYSKLFFSHNEGLTEISFEVERSTLAAAVGRSTTTASQINEFSWNKGKLQEVTSSEKMDTAEVEQTVLSPTELIAQKIMEEGSVYLKYIPESELVKLLQLAIGCRFKERNKNLDIKPDIILAAIFSASFNDVFLVKYMKKLNLEETMITLETLLSFLNDKIHPTNVTTKPSDLQLFNWICLVIQSHMEALLLSKDKKCIKLLRKLDKCLTEKMKEYEDYESVQNMFHLIQKKNNVLPEKYVDAKYCIETLDT